ncbi:MAG: hypothetical protein H6704_07045 [Myxococcales bacterium]|nr:hypothetical protein [Myxococcales bacterium]
MVVVVVADDDAADASIRRAGGARRASTHTARLETLARRDDHSGAARRPLVPHPLVRVPS